MGRDTVDLTVVVPVRNEERRLAGCLSGLVAVLSELSLPAGLLVVDNGSTDASAAIAAGWRRRSARRGVPMELTRCDERGKGAAVRTGVLASTTAYVGFCDADLATDMRALHPALDLLGRGSNVVVGSRAHPASVVSARHSTMRNAGAWAFRRLVARLVPGVGDTQCGFKFFAGPVARRAATDLTATGFAFDVELIARCSQLGADMVEIPVNWQDIPGSTFSIWRHSLPAFAEIARIRLALRSRSSWAETDAEGAPADPMHGQSLPTAPVVQANFGTVGQQ